MSKTCILCVHWLFDPGSADFSELTPGDDWTSGCQKLHWTFSGHGVSRSEYKDALMSADTCLDYDEEE